MLKYNGKGFLTGVPARDLTDDEVNQFGKDKLLKSGLYTEEGKERSKKSKRLETAESVVEDIDNGTGH